MKNRSAHLLLSIFPLFLVACANVSHEAEIETLSMDVGEKSEAIVKPFSEKQIETKRAYKVYEQNADPLLKNTLSDDLLICSNKPWLEDCQVTVTKGREMNQWEVATQGRDTLEHEKPLLPTQQCGGKDAEGREIFIEDNPSYLPSRNRTCY